MLEALAQKATQFAASLLAVADALNQITKGIRNIVDALQDLKDSVTGIGTAIAAELQAVTDKIASITAANAGSVPAADVESVVSDINALKTKITDFTASLGSPAPVPAPAAQ